MGEIKSRPLIDRLSNPSGQFLIETVLLMLLSMGFFVFLINQLKSMELVRSIVQDPWAKVAGMIESGSWEPPGKARRLHPNQTERGCHLIHRPLSMTYHRWNHSGNVTAEFLFSMVLVSGFLILFFSFCFTFTVVEIAQYIAYSTSRAQAGAHATPEKQKQMAESKFKSLVTHPQLKHLFITSGWIQLGRLELKDGVNGNDFNSEYNQDPAKRIPYVGARFDFIAKVLTMRLPFLGETTNGGDLSAKITGFLIREPSAKECFEQVADRYLKIMDLEPGRFNKLPKAESLYNKISEDNGC